MSGIFLIAIVVIPVLIYLGILYFNNKRTKTLAQLAPSLSFTFSAKDGQSLISTLGGFHLFSLGYSRRITNIFSGKFNLIPVKVFDYRYTTGGGKSSHTWQQTVMIFEPDKLQMPRFMLRPENLFDKIGSIFGNKDINFDMAPVFSKKYQLRGEDETAVRGLFNPRVLDYYEHNPGVSTESDGAKFIFYRTSKLIRPENIQSFLQEGYQVYNLYKNR
jgi:carbonic anhydrase